MASTEWGPLQFLKMADERSQPVYSQPSLFPAHYAWPVRLARDGDVLFDHDRHMLEALCNKKGNLPPPEVIAQEIVEDLEAALE